jgi:DnaJ like chaperone protein
MAKADGQVSQAEVRAFKEVFHVPQEEMDNVARVFNQARRDSAGFEEYARQVAGMFPDAPAVLEELLWCLAHIARADGAVHPGELAFLRKVAEIFGLDDAAFERVTALRPGGSGEAAPYKMLGVTRAADTDAIKAAHRALVRENHPDRLIAQGMPEEFVALANEKLAAINAAWDRIKTERGVI